MLLWGLLVQPILMFVLTVASAALISGLMLNGDDLPVWLGLSILLFWLFAPPALYGNRVYYSIAMRRIEQARKRFDDGQAQRAWLAKSGGRSWWWPGGAVVVLVALLSGAANEQRKKAEAASSVGDAGTQGMSVADRLAEFKRLGREAARKRDLIAAEDYLNKALQLAPNDAQLREYEKRLRDLKAGKTQ